MRTKIAVLCLIAGAALAPVISFAAEDTDMDRSHPKAFVKDSASSRTIER